MGDAVSLRVRLAGGAETTLRAAYVVGCDGAHSRVRELIGVGFPGGTYARMYYVADVDDARPDHEPGASRRRSTTPISWRCFRWRAMARRASSAPCGGDAVGDREPGWDDVSSHAIERMQLDIERVNWFSTYRVHHRVARHFRRGRIFLAGDAAHIHSPVGGQGMNTGIGDAVNLAWKLASVVAGEAAPALLDSYEPERIRFARRLVASTDRAFSFVTRDGAIARRVRMGLVPRLLPRLGRRRWFRRVMFRALSQTDLHYHRSRLSAGRTGRVRAGDRLPWVRLGSDGSPDGDNFAPLRSMDWQLHVYGVASPALQRTAAARDLPLHVFPFERARRRRGAGAQRRLPGAPGRLHRARRPRRPRLADHPRTSAGARAPAAARGRRRDSGGTRPPLIRPPRALRPTPGQREHRR